MSCKRLGDQRMIQQARLVVGKELLDCSEVAVTLQVGEGTHIERRGIVGITDLWREVVLHQVRDLNPQELRL